MSISKINGDMDNYLTLTIFILLCGMVGLTLILSHHHVFGVISPEPAEEEKNKNFLPNATGDLPPAICCHQFGEGNEWGDERK